MSIRFDGRVALVTGAGKGLGRAYAEWLAAHGAKVVVNNRSHAGKPSSAMEVVTAIRAAGGEAVADSHDICDRIESALKTDMDHLVITIHVEPEGKAKQTGVLVL